ncbi:MULTISPECIES: phage holin family protein [unclassified Novosphingobium]|uniref:phage holin family protein n=1 Tax=unclassified Novosphingobium TaxID=2644732 RepID=UPI00146CC672|nr:MULTISPECIES: phage holin family protein [unclassified Novosphingobium]NMN03769.1 hypothetical protein [Novosphingobium sp. SG919]NMN86241.1 hypothetical protein [Novosphingobium sp. SG916]
MPDSSGAEAEATPLAARLEALLRQGETLLGAELAYQKARVGFGWSRGKHVALYLALAGAFGGLTLVALVVGLLIALAPLLTPWGALAVVGLGLALLSALWFRAAVRAFRDARDTVLGKPTKAEEAVVAAVQENAVQESEA